MTYDELYVLVPCHSLEDFPTELGDRPAEGLLNAWAVLWHPALLATANSIPRWARADDALEIQPSRLVIVPPASDSLTPQEWITRARQGGMNVVTGVSERGALLAAALGPLTDAPSVDPDLAADFVAFGHLHLQTELLTRHMRQFGNLDDEHLGREAVSAARSAVAGDGDAARTHLKHCFEMLLEARERFYPVDCYLLDLCLLSPRLAGEPFERLLADDTPVNLLGTAGDLDEIVSGSPAIQSAIRERWEAGSLDVLGGEWAERCVSLLPLDATLHELLRGRARLRDLFGKTPTTWGRRRYGPTPLMPQLLKRCGYHSSLHFVMDDGAYPDEEYAKLQWQGCDGSTIAAYSRIPLAGDSAAAFLRFPVRMSESMDHDHVAGLVFARWPEMRSPWLDDFRRAHRYAPALGRFVTFEKFFHETELDGRMSEFRQGVYLSPFLVQAVARREAGPVTRYVDYWRRRRLFEALDWCRGTAELLGGASSSRLSSAALEQALAASGPDVPPAEGANAAATIDADLAAAREQALKGLHERLMIGADSRRGMLVCNSLAFGRKTVIDWPEEFTLPPAEGPVIARQISDSTTGGRRSLVVELPPCGYAWIPGDAPQSAPPAPDKVPLAEDLLVRNEFVEVSLSETTGGIAQVRTYGRGGNRLSQQLAWRFPREKTLPDAEEGGPARKTWYSEMRLREARVLSSGPASGAIETVGDLIDPSNNKLLATYRQTVQVWRGRPFVEVEIELGLETTPTGDPWSNYVAARFAWSDSSLTLTRCAQGTAQPVKEEQRIESPDYLELAADSTRTTILTGGLPFHRLTGSRMLDTLLVTEGEATRRFKFAIAVDQNYPLAAALDWETPALCLPTEQGPPRSGPAAWLFQVGARNVQLRRVFPLPSTPTAESGEGCILRLQETEGRNKTFQLGCFRPLLQARQLDFNGQTLHGFKVEGGLASVSIAPYELCDVEVRFA